VISARAKITMRAPSDARKRDLQSAARWVGRLALVGSLVFVGFAVHTAAQSGGLALLTKDAWLRIALASFGYAILMQFVALAWTLALRGAGNGVPGVLPCLLIFGRTQIYKYLPSNVLHMVGRYQATRQAGASRAALGLAQLSEITVILLAAASVSAVLGYSVFAQDLERHVGTIGPPTLLAIAGSLVALVVAAGVVLVRRAGGSPVGAAGAVAGAFVLYVLFFVGNGALMAFLIAGLAQEAPALVWIVGVTTIAWVIGYVVPGAPGGLGVRDASLIASLGASLPVEIAVAAALAHRLVTTLGDVIVAAVAVLMTRATLRGTG